MYFLEIQKALQHKEIVDDLNFDALLFRMRINNWITHQEHEKYQNMKKIGNIEEAQEFAITLVASRLSASKERLLEGLQIMTSVMNQGYLAEKIEKMLNISL